jgi:hypothetical protein
MWDIGWFLVKEILLGSHSPPSGHLLGPSVFIQKRNENSEVVRYKARLDTHGFTQRPIIDFNKTYSTVMN